jgi:murein DD-endopeptidase MepM/ murein hydrolase activator NlpD
VYRGRVDGLTIVGVAFFIFIIFNVLSDRGWFSGVSQLFNQPRAVSADAPEMDNDTDAQGGETQADIAAPQVGDPDALGWPYAQYEITQGPHGMSYGHMAIDLTAGNGATILSPINGIVSEHFIDQYGNPTLILDNPHYQILMLHGNYTVQVGQTVTLGQPVGTESNQGYTLDAFGQLCAGRDCGYHTHLNIFDKQLGVNVNPLDVLPR